MDYERWYNACRYLLELGFDLDRNSARDLLGAINEIFNNDDLDLDYITE